MLEKIKLSYLIDMSFDVPDSEKRIASEALEMLEKLLSLIMLSEEHLDIIYDAFYGKTLSPNEVYEKRGVLNRYRKKIKENFSDIKFQSINIIKKLYFFSSDTQMMELLNTIKDAMDMTEKKVVKLLDFLNDFKSKTFIEDIIKTIDEIKESTKELKDLTKERVIDFIEENILAKNLTEGLGIEEKVPLIQQLYEERKQNMAGIPQATKPNQILNPGNQQRIWYPTDSRESSFRGE